MTATAPDAPTAPASAARQAGRTQIARTATRAEPEARTPDRSLGDRGPIVSRSGKATSLRITGDIDPFFVPPEVVPDGWTYEWKTKTVYNWEHVQHQVSLSMNGWEPVPAERHDGMFMPIGHDGPIERGGMILMERDDRLTAQSREIDRRKAMDPVVASRQMAGLMPPSDVVDFSHSAAQRVTGVKVDRQARVSDAKYQYAIDE
jgi:hypothetical protein